MVQPERASKLASQDLLNFSAIQLEAVARELNLYEGPPLAQLSPLVQERLRLILREAISKADGNPQNSYVECSINTRAESSLRQATPSESILYQYEWDLPKAAMWPLHYTYSDGSATLEVAIKTRAGFPFGRQHANCVTLDLPAALCREFDHNVSLENAGTYLSYELIRATRALTIYLTEAKASL